LKILKNICYTTYYNIWCSFKFILKVGAEKSIVKAPRIRSRISCLILTSLFALFVFLLCRWTSGAFTIDSSTPINFQNHRMIEISSSRSEEGNKTKEMDREMKTMIKETREDTAKKERRTKY
jgi:hypothetical protein